MSEIVHILVLSLETVPFVESGERFLKTLKDHAEINVYEASDIDLATYFLQNVEINVIILTDWSLHRSRNQELFALVTRWLHNTTRERENTIIMGCFFHQRLDPAAFERYMERWLLPWRLRHIPLPQAPLSISDQTFSLNHANAVYEDQWAHTFEEEYSLQSTRVIENVRRDHGLYHQPTSEDQIEEPDPAEYASTPVAFVKLNSYLGNLGCFPNLPVEGDLVDIVLGMCGILKIFPELLDLDISTHGPYAT